MIKNKFEITSLSIGLVAALLVVTALTQGFVFAQDPYSPPVKNPRVAGVSIATTDSRSIIQASCYIKYIKISYGKHSNDTAGGSRVYEIDAFDQSNLDWANHTQGATIETSSINTGYAWEGQYNFNTKDLIDGTFGATEPGTYTFDYNDTDQWAKVTLPELKKITKIQTRQVEYDLDREVWEKLTIQTSPDGLHWSTWYDNYESYNIPGTAEVTCVPTTIVACEAGQIIGDLNNDGLVTVTDSLMASDIIIGVIPTPSDICCIDVQQDGDFDLYDQLEIIDIANGVKTSPGTCQGELPFSIKRAWLEKSGSSVLSYYFFVEVITEDGTPPHAFGISPWLVLTDETGRVTETSMMYQSGGHDEYLNKYYYAIGIGSCNDIDDYEYTFTASKDGQSVSTSGSFTIPCDPILSCEDSDNGMNYLAKGTLVIKDTKATFTNVDFCSDGNVLIENYCNDENYSAIEIYNCSNGCSDGACIEEPDDCTPADNKICDANDSNIIDTQDFKSMTYTESGDNLILELEFWSNPIDIPSMISVYFSSAKDAADSTIRVFRDSYALYWGDTPNAGWYHILKHSGTPEINGNVYKMTIPKDLILDGDFSTIYYWTYSQHTRDRMPDSGYFEIKLTDSHVCSDSDNGKDYDTKGTVHGKGGLGMEPMDYTDRCIDNSNLKEFYCSNNWATETRYTCPYGCSAGACRVKDWSCSETDDGLDYNSKGKITQTSGDGSQITHEDSCNTDSVLRAYTCPNGCENGACKVTSSCFDSDGGKNPGTKGYVETDEYGKIWDYCDKYVDNAVREFSCRTDGGSGYVVTVHKCPFRCLDGTCIPNEEIGELNITPGLLASENLTACTVNQQIGKFEFTAENELINVEQLSLKLLVDPIDGSNSTPKDITNLSVYNSQGNVVAGPIDITDIEQSSGWWLGSATTTDTFTVPGGTSTYKVKADLNCNLVNGDKIQIGIAPHTTVAKGLSTGKDVTPTPGYIQWYAAQKIVTGNLNVSISPYPVAQDVLSGAQDHHFAKYILDAVDSSEGVKISQIKVAITVEGASANELSNLRLFNGNEELSVINDPDSGLSSIPGQTSYATFTLARPLIVPKGGNIILNLKANISRSTSVGDVFQVGMHGPSPITAVGSISGNTIRVHAKWRDGQKMRIAGSGTLYLDLDASTPKSSILPSNTTGRTVGVMRATALNEDIRIEKIYLTAEQINNGGWDQIDRLYLYDGSTLLASVYPTSSDAVDRTVIIDKTNDPIIISNDSYRNITVKVDTADVNGLTGSKGEAGQGFKLKINSPNDVTAKGSDSSRSITPSSVPTFRSFILYKSIPLVTTNNQLGADGVASGTLASGIESSKNLYRFNVIANESGDIAIYRVSFLIHTKNASVTNLVLSDGNGNVASGVKTDDSTYLSTGDMYSFIFTNDGNIPSSDRSNISPDTVASTRANTYTLKGDVVCDTSGVTPCAGSKGQGAIAIQLLGDGAPLPTYPDSALNLENKFYNAKAIWSDLSQTLNTAHPDALTASQWTNAYLVRTAHASYWPTISTAVTFTKDATATYADTITYIEPEPVIEDYLSKEPVVEPEEEPAGPSTEDLTNADPQYLEFKEKLATLKLKVTILERQVVELERALAKEIDINLTLKVKGYILLQVEENGEAWYVDPQTEKKFYLKDGDSAYNALQAFGLGITNENLAKIPIGIEDRADVQDSDNDGLDDKLEESLGTNLYDNDSDNDGFDDKTEVKDGFDPNGSGKLKYQINFVDLNNLRGKIVLQVESRGEAWYINPNDGKRYYMKDGALAYQIMRFLSLGITNEDLRKIDVGEF